MSIKGFQTIYRIKKTVILGFFVNYSTNTNNENNNE